MKVIVTGASGMVGKGILLECLDHASVTKVLSIGRKSIGLSHPKLEELIHKDFSEFASVAEKLKGYDACYHSMGVSAASLKEDAYTHFTYDFTMALGNTLLKLNSEMTFNYVSGQGTDSSEKGRAMWARVKGKTENDLLKLGFKQSFMFRPGAIIPVRGATPSSQLYKKMIKGLTWLIKLVKKIAPNKVVDTSQIGLAMVHVTKRGYAKKIINPEDILNLAID